MLPVRLESEHESHTFMVSHSQGFLFWFGFFPSSPSISSLKRLCNASGSSFSHSFPGYPVPEEKHQIREKEMSMISAHSVKHSSLQDFGDPT